MTREEAIKELEKESCYECSWGCESMTKCTCPKCSLKEAVGMAIEALKEQIPHGEWIIKDNDVICPFCSYNGFNVNDIIAGDANYCPNCGSDMRIKTDFN